MNLAGHGLPDRLGFLLCREVAQMPVDAVDRDHCPPPAPVNEMHATDAGFVVPVHASISLVLISRRLSQICPPIIPRAPVLVVYFSCRKGAFHPYPDEIMKPIPSSFDFDMGVPVSSQAGPARFAFPRHRSGLGIIIEQFPDPLERQRISQFRGHAGNPLRSWLWRSLVNQQFRIRLNALEIVLHLIRTMELEIGLTWSPGPIGLVASPMSALVAVDAVINAFV